MRILVVEDEPDLRAIIGKRLQKEGYTVDLCADGAEAGDFLDSGGYDLVILDIMLPRVDGLTLLRQRRAQGDKTLVLLLTARDSVEDRVTGMDAGSDDYLIKPFSFEELLARVRMLLRRQAGQADNLLQVGDLCLQLQTHTVTRGGREIHLSNKEYTLLEYLMHNPNVVLSRRNIEEHIWGWDYDGGTNLVDVYIRYLRKKIDDPFPRKLLHTVRGAGYVLKEEA